MDCYVSISHCFRILFWWIVTLVSRALFYDSLLMDCYVSISCTVLGFSFEWLLREYLAHPYLTFDAFGDTLASWALLAFSFEGLLRRYFANRWDFLVMECFVSISRTASILFRCVVMFVSRSLLSILFNGFNVMFVSWALSAFSFEGLLR